MSDVSCISKASGALLRNTGKGNPLVDILFFWIHVQISKTICESSECESRILAQFLCPQEFLLLFSSSSTLSLGPYSERDLKYPDKSRIRPNLLKEEQLP